MGNCVRKYIYYFQITNNQNEYAKCSEFNEDICHGTLKDFQEYNLTIKNGIYGYIGRNKKRVAKGGNPC